MILNTKPDGVEVQNPKLGFKPHKHTPKIIYEHGKIRKIFEPEIHEQWLHHIIVLVLEPIITGTAYKYSCGSFPKRGAHYAKRRIEKWLRSDPKGTRNFLKVDIRHFYDSIRLDVLMRELTIRIKDEWFLHVIWLCLREFKKGIPLGFYISQWLANYLLEPLDKLITETLGLDKLVRYMDDVTIYAAAKKALHNADVQIRKMLGQRFRLKLKKNRQVCKFFYQGKRKAMGRPLDFMGFVFYRDKTIIRKRIMLKATQTARHLHKAKEAGRSYCRHNIAAMLSYMGWFSCTDTYECFKRRIKPNVKIGKLKEIISKLDRRKKNHETLGTRSMLQPA